MYFGVLDDCMTTKEKGPALGVLTFIWSPQVIGEQVVNMGQMVN